MVNEDQLSLAIGKRGQNVRLAARLTGWDIDILTPKEYNKGLEDLEKSLKTIEGVNEQMLDRMVALGIINLLDIEEMGTEPLVKELEIPQELADKIVDRGGRGSQADRRRRCGAARPPKRKPSERRFRRWMRPWPLRRPVRDQGGGRRRCCEDAP